MARNHNSKHNSIWRSAHLLLFALKHYFDSSGRSVKIAVNLHSTRIFTANQPFPFSTRTLEICRWIEGIWKMMNRRREPFFIRLANSIFSFADAFTEIVYVCFGGDAKRKHQWENISHFSRSTMMNEMENSVPFTIRKRSNKKNSFFVPTKKVSNCNSSFAVCCGRDELSWSNIHRHQFSSSSVLHPPTLVQSFNFFSGRFSISC